jgi:1,4-alpha-glucan branching enzyme
VPREGYRIGVPLPGGYREVFNSDLGDYAGSGIGNGGKTLLTEELNWMDRPHSLVVTLPPLAGIILKPEPTPASETDVTVAAAEKDED